MFVGVERIEMLSKKAHGNDKDAKEQLEVAQALLDYTEDGSLVSTFKDVEFDGFVAEFLIINHLGVSI